MSTISFLNIGMHGRVNPTLPVVAELVRRGHTVTYHTSPAFRAEIEATGATVCLRTFATALAPLGGTVVVSTGQTDPAALDPLPAGVIARRFVPQPEVLARAALFVTHGGMNSVNEAMHAGVPMLVVPQGADQPMVARRVVELGAGLSLRTQDVTEDSVRALARRLLDDSRFRAEATTLQAAQHKAGGYQRAADELEPYLHAGRLHREAVS